MSSAEVWRYVARWTEEPPLAVVVRAVFGVKPPEANSESGLALSTKTEMTQEEWDEMVAGMKANVEMYGRRRN